MSDPILQSEIARIPSGCWAVGVSGGADSTALLFLVHRRPDLKLHAIHLNHQLRGQASDGDERFVAELCTQLNVQFTVARRGEIHPMVGGKHSNPSAHYRALRLALFARTVAEHRLDGVLLAHHADDQAETIALRLLRGSGVLGLGGMKFRQRIAGILVVRPLLQIRRSALVEFLRRHDRQWREDASNQSPAYARNRVRQWLGDHQACVEPLLRLGRASRALIDWTNLAAPALDAVFPAKLLEDFPALLARAALRCWLIRQGAAPGEVPRAAIDRLLAMATDAATPPRQQFPGEITVIRRAGRISRA